METDQKDFFESDWFKERPLQVQQLFKERSPAERWYLKAGDSDEYYGVVIIGADGDEEPTLRIYVSGPLPPLTERQVFGIKKEDLFTLDQIQGKKILYKSWEPFEKYK